MRTAVVTAYYAKDFERCGCLRKQDMRMKGNGCIYFGCALRRCTFKTEGAGDGSTTRPSAGWLRACRTRFRWPQEAGMTPTACRCAAGCPAVAAVALSRHIEEAAMSLVDSECAVRDSTRSFMAGRPADAFPERCGISESMRVQDL